jgi:tetratricopeptide (TPR) repeat protein
MLAGIVLASCADTPTAPEPAPAPPPARVEPSPPPAPVTPQPARPRSVLPPDSPPPNTAAARSRAQNFVRQSFELLDQGEDERARILLEQAVLLDTDNRSAACLLRGIRADPMATLGRESTPYAVRPGDTLGSIAKRALGDTCEFFILARYNQIPVPRHLAAGQVIRIPGRVALAPADPVPASPRVPTPRPAEAVRVPPPEPAQDAPAPAPQAPAETSPAPTPTTAQDTAATRALIEQHYRNGQAAYSRQDLATAIREWDKVLELDPGNELARARREQAVALQKKLQELGK